MDLRELRIVRLPGIDRPFTIEAGPGLNLVVGPNGSGKSSLCRATLGLLWPTTAPGGDLSATWQEDGTVWHAVRTGGPVVAWQRDGQPGNGPELPALAQASAFRLGMLDLHKLQADETDQDLARAIRNQMAGGYDLMAMLEHQVVSGKEGLKKAGDLKAANLRVAALRQEKEALVDEETSLPRLRREWDEARQAGLRVDALEAADQVVRTRNRAEEAAALLAQRYPGVMADLQEDAAERLQLLRDRQQRTTSEQAQAEQAGRDAEDTMARADLADGGPGETHITTARKHLDETRVLATQFDQACADQAAMEAAHEKAREQLKPWPQLSTEGDIDPAALRATATVLRDQLKHDAEVRGLEGILAGDDISSSESPLPDPGDLSRARQHLVAWLEAAHERRLPWLELLIGTALMAFGAWLRPWEGDWHGWVVGGLGLVTLMGALIPYLARPRTKRALADHAASNQTGPGSWNEDEVRAILEALIVEESETRLESLHRELRHHLERRRDQARDDLASISPGSFDPVVAFDAAELLHRSAAHHQTGRDLAAASTKVDSLRAQRDQRLQAIVTVLSPWLDSLSTSGDSSLALAPMAARLDDLDQRRTAYHQAQRDRAEAQRRQADAADRAAEAAAEITALLASQKLEPDQDAILRARVTRLTTYRQEAAEADQAATELKLRQAALGNLPPELQTMAQGALDFPASELATQLTSARVEAAQTDDLQRRITAVETRLDQAGRDAALDVALAHRDHMAADLGDLRDDVRGTALRRLLLQRLRRQHRRLSEPPVLARARDIFLSFTDGQYELTVPDGNQESFRARDTRTGQGLALDQLSDGTRAQLLLASRLAYLREAERGAMLPLFLDESLTASDPVRFRAVGRAVLKLMADDHRQVFYLTSNPADVQAWQQLLAGEGLPESPVIDLAKIRDLADGAALEQLITPVQPTIPSPEVGEDPAAYGSRLNVPALDAQRPATEAHLFHLLRDQLSLLHALLVRHVVQLGQVESLAAVLEADEALTQSARATLLARGRALAMFLETMAVGRGRPVPRGTLLQESGIKTNKLEEVEETLGKLNGDAASLMEALANREVSNLTLKKQAELEEWLQREDYLDRRPILPLGQVKETVFNAMRKEVEAGSFTMMDLDTMMDTWWSAAGG